MFRNFAQIRKDLLEYDIQGQFVGFCENVSKSTEYIYPEVSSYKVDRHIKGYGRWAEPVACLSRLALNGCSPNELSDTLKKAELSTKDLNELRLCFLSCHRWSLISKDSDDTKNQILKLKGIIYSELISRKDTSSVILNDLNPDSIRNITLQMGISEVSSQMEVKKNFVAGEPMYLSANAIMADILLKDEFDLIKGHLNNTTMPDYINYLIDIKRGLTINELGSGIEEFSPLYFLRDENYEALGSILVKNKVLMNNFLSNWVSLSIPAEFKDIGD